MSKAWREHHEQRVQQFLACDWPGDVDFRVGDTPGEHDPVFVWMPDGAGIEFNHHAGEGVDMARAQWIAEACNQRLAHERGDREGDQ